VISSDYKDFRKLRGFKRQSDAALKETSTVAPAQPSVPEEQHPDESGAAAQDQNMGDDWQPLNDVESEHAEPGPSQHVKRVKSMNKSNKENVRLSERPGLPKPRNFNSPQPDARSLVWDEESQEGTQQERAKTQQSPRRVAGKRPRPADVEEDEDDVSPDEGYENDARQSTAADRRRQELNASKQAKQPVKSPPKRPRTELSGSSGQARDRASQGSSTPDYDINRQTQSNVRRPTQVTVRARPRAPQQRRGWTLDEETALIDYVEEYGTSWSLIKQIDRGHPLADNDNGDGPNHLKYRDQVALKDKARNLRFDYHK
jgi:hypothetical protein